MEGARDSRGPAVTDPWMWALTGTELQELRDQREAQLPCKIFHGDSIDRVPPAMDLLVQRLRELKMAKGVGGSWEKAAAVSLQAGSVPAATSLPDGAMVL